MKIFITGGDGFLGCNLIKILLERNYQLRVLIQPQRKNDTLVGLPVELVMGDILDYHSLTEAARGTDVIIHLAANTNIWPARSKIVRQVNIEGTKNILRLAKEIQVKKLIHVGTANSFSFGTKNHPGGEDTGYICNKYGLDYMDSKWKAHQLVLEAIKEGVPAVIVNPTFMIGPYDSNPGSGAMILAIYKHKIPGYTCGGKNCIHVKDAAIGIANALEKGKIGECYILGNVNLSYREIFEKIAQVVEVKPPRWKIPRWAALFWGGIGSVMGYIRGKKPMVSWVMAKISCDQHYYSAVKANKELDLPKTPIETAIQDSFKWLKLNGYLTHEF